MFDLLLPFLQPPLEPYLDQPVLFPPGRRPYPYQITGIRFLAERFSALLGDEMGLGKTIQAIIAIQLLFRQRLIRNALIVCPLSVLGTWLKEIEKWAPELFVLKIRGNQEIREFLWKASASIFLTTYETLRNDSDRNIVLSTKYDLVLLDEIQRIKNPNSATSKAMRNLDPKYRWGLSGTPLENRIEDIISIFRFLKSGLFKTTDEGLNQYRVRERFAPYFLRRRVADVRSELPDKLTERVWLELSRSQRHSYDALRSEAVRRLSHPDATRMHVFAEINGLKKICNMDIETKESCKRDYLNDQLKIITESGYKALVFSQFPKVTLKEIEQELSDFRPALYHGGLSSQQRERILESFQAEDIPKVLLMSLKAGSLGITLTRANHVFHFDHWWNPAVSRQAEARAYRIGQKNTVFVYELYTIGTIEERILEILTKKQQLFDEVIDELSEVAMSALNDEELFGLFDLEPPETMQKEGDRDRTIDRIRAYFGKLRALSPYQFEDLVGDFYRNRGFNVEVTSRARDEGVDVIARRPSDVGTDHLIIQCKHYPEGTVGSPEVRNLIGAWQDHPKANRAVMVTSGKFSQNAIDLANRNNIDLIDGSLLCQILLKEGISIG